MKLGDVLKLNKKSLINIEDNQSYEISGVQNYGQGIVIRRKVLGSELTMKKYQTIEKNQLMWCKVDTKNGAFGLTHDEHIGSLASTNMALADININLINPEFLEVLFRQKAFADYITKFSSGSTNRKYLTPKQLFEKIELPDLNLGEQQKFIEKLKRIEKVGIEYEIQTQKQLLSQLKQSILQEAIQGKLTAEWRAKRALIGAEVEPASELLKRIKTEKAQLIKDKLIKKEKALPSITAANVPFELPEGWVWCRLGDICNNITSGSTPSKESFYSSEIPYLKVYNIRNQKIDFDYKPQFILKSVHETSLKRCMLKPNDVVMNIVGPPLGKVAVIPEQYPEWNCNQAIAIFRCIDANVNRFIYQYLCAGLYLNYLHYKGMAGQDNISVTMCKELVIGLPSLSEQQAIVEKVETLMQKCQALEQEIKNSEAHAQILMQSVLKEAFEGKEEVVVV